MQVVHTEVSGAGAIVRIDNLPGNATSTRVRAALLQAISKVQTCERAILTATGRTFVAGGDMTEFDRDPEPPDLPDVVQAIEDSETPFVAALHGNVLGGGLELAMACVARVAAPNTRFGLPEVNIGLVPGAGGTQRAPRLLGWEMAFEMACLGKLFTADDLLAVGGVDQIADDPLKAAQTLVLPDRVAVSRRAAPSVPQGWAKAKRAVATTAAKGAAAPLHNLDMLLAAKCEFNISQPKERALHLRLRNSDESKALRHAFFAERSVLKPAAVAAGKPKEISRIAVVGGGLMGTGISMAALMAGLNVSIIERDSNAAKVAESRAHEMIAGAVKRGKASEERAAAMRNALSASTEYSAAAKAELVIEAVFEDLGVKRQVFAETAEFVRDDAILATNTSYIDPREIFAGIPNQARCVGLHFFAPAHIMRLLEVVRLEAISSDTLATAFVLAKKMRKTPVLSGICDGFIGNRMLAAYRRAAEYMLVDGSFPYQIDRAMTEFGYPMGPFAVQDLSGLQITYANRKRQAQTRDPDERYVEILDQLYEEGRIGQRSGKGWHNYPSGRSPVRSSEVEEIVEQYSRTHGIERRSFSEAEIQDRLIAALANEGARIVEEGIAENDAAVDVVKLLGFGFPRRRGGPMHMAASRGASRIKAALTRLESDSPKSWARATRYQ